MKAPFFFVLMGIGVIPCVHLASVSSDPPSHQEIDGLTDDEHPAKSPAKPSPELAKDEKTVKSSDS